MADYTELLKIIKQAGSDAVNASKPTTLCFGKITSDNPLKILVDQKMELGEAQLILARQVTDYTTTCTINWSTENALTTHTHGISGGDSGGDSISLTSTAANLSHKHAVAGTKSITIHNKLKVGEQVVLLRMQGGQKYLVLDRIGV